MKKLLCTAAICGLAIAATPANAGNGVKLDVGGYFKGYGVYIDQDHETGEDDYRNFDIIRDTEVHFGGETTLDNGLTVGAHIEATADGNGNDGFTAQESYVYFSGDWGRVNFGAEDGAAYLLQVETPSADDNLDGLRQFVQPVNFESAGLGNGDDIFETDLNTIVRTEDGFLGQGGIDYDQDVSGDANKFTYLSPIFNGFQFGGSYTPDVEDVTDGNSGVDADGVDDTYGDAWELGARYEGQFNNVGVILGGGWSHVGLEDDFTNAESLALGAGTVEVTDDIEAWNLGADLDIGPFGVGVAYTSTDYGDYHEGVAGAGTLADDTSDDEEIWNVGVDYTTGPFKLGASYYDSSNVYGNEHLDAQRWTGGVVYTYGPGMTFRGSVSNIDFDNTDDAVGTVGDSVDATSVMLGTQINF